MSERLKVTAAVERAFRERDAARAEVGRLLSCLMRIAEGGADGISEAGCTWCLTSTEHANYSPIAGTHLSGCPVDDAIGTRTTSATNVTTENE